MNAHVTNIFRDLTLFDGLSRDTIDGLYSRGSVVELDAGEELFTLGSEPDALYVLLRGRLVAIGLDPVIEREQAKGFVQPGEIVGEMGLISKKPRSLTIRAQLDSVLFRLSEEEFTLLLNEHPEILAPITRGVVARLHQMLTETSGGNGPQTVMMVGANAGIVLEDFMHLLRSVLQDMRANAIVINESDMLDRIGKRGDGNKLITWMRGLDQEYELVFYSCSDLGSDMFRQVLQFTERFVVIGDGNGKVDYDPRLIAILQGEEYQHYAKELILLYSEREIRKLYVTEWLEGLHYFRHHHVSLGNEGSVQRFCRFMTGTARALVLAGGGTRGWAHVGAMRAFYEIGLEFDLVGGTSAGSVVSAIYARGTTYEELSEWMDKLLRSSLEVLRMSNYTLPVVSISNAKANTLLLQRLFGETQIEQLERMFFCISCNITRSEEAIHSHGLLWQALRASCSVPGIAPPVVIGGELYVDGGIINNMPVDVARHRLDGLGHVIAVDLSMTKVENPQYFFPPVLPLPHLVGHRLGLVKRGYQFSTIGNIIMSTMMACSERRMAENRALADVVIRPPLRGYGMLDDSREELVELGYRAAAKAL